MQLLWGFSPDVAAYAMTSSITWAFIAVYWIWLWRSTVRWTRNRVALTVAAFPAAMVPGAIVGVAMAAFDDDFGAFVGGVTAILLWLFLTVFAWRETLLERTERVRRRSANTLVCPTCGYNLTGLQEPTCPECGTVWALDELYALQPGREADL